MKTGIILEIRCGKATVMLTGGAFVTLRAQPQWKPGDAVSLPRSENTFPHRRRLLTAAACFLLLFSAAAGCGLWYAPAALVSLDVNPSIEIQVNRFDRVIRTEAYNEEADEILNRSNVNSRRIDHALESLFVGGLQTYLQDSPYITYSVASDNAEQESSLIASLKIVTDSLLERYPDTADTFVDYYAVDSELVADAHGHHVTAGKYMKLLKLQAVMPEAELDEYAHCSIGELDKEIQRCSSVHEKTPDEQEYQEYQEYREPAHRHDSEHQRHRQRGNNRHE